LGAGNKLGAGDAYTSYSIDGAFLENIFARERSSSEEGVFLTPGDVVAGNLCTEGAYGFRVSTAFAPLACAESAHARVSMAAYVHSRGAAQFTDRRKYRAGQCHAPRRLTPTSARTIYL